MSDKRKSTLIVDSITVGFTKYELRKIGCGKAACGRCPHGPYWYMLITTRHGKQIKRYVGKNPTEELAQALEKRGQADSFIPPSNCPECGEVYGASPGCPECKVYNEVQAAAPALANATTEPAESQVQP